MTGKKPSRFERFFVCVLLAIGVATLGWGLTVKHFQPQKSPYPPTKYSRADCIVRINISYPEGYKAGYMIHMRRIITGIMKEAVEQNSLPIGAASLGQPTPPEALPETDPVYIQFYDKCERKTAMAQQMVAAFEDQYFDRQAAAESGQVSPYVIEERLKPTLTVTEDRIKPSVETILYGNNDLLSPPIWTDVDDQ